MTGTFGGALEVRHIDASNGRLTSEVSGEIELEEKVLVIRRIHVHYKLRAAEDQRETVEHAYRIHVDRCPLARSLRGSIEITTSLEFVS